jgi:glycerophosphoryl diester phosphodiesterase
VTPKTVYGHRGAPAELPENTLEGFARALEVGADAIETDVHLTACGTIVVFHDATATRTAGHDAKVAESTLAEVRTWDVGKQHPKARAPFRVPTLREALRAFPEAFFNVDLKPASDELVRAAVAQVRELGAEERVRLTSFHARNVRTARRLGYATTGLGATEVLSLVALPAGVLERLGPHGRAAQIPVNQGPVRLDGARFIDKCHSLGIRVDYWTIDDPREAARLFALGADGIVTNDPRTIVPVAKAYAAV